MQACWLPSLEANRLSWLATLRVLENESSVWLDSVEIQVKMSCILQQLCLVGGACRKPTLLVTLDLSGMVWLPMPLLDDAMIVAWPWLC